MLCLMENRFYGAFQNFRHNEFDFFSISLYTIANATSEQIQEELPECKQEWKDDRHGYHSSLALNLGMWICVGVYITHKLTAQHCTLADNALDEQPESSFEEE